MQVGEKTYEVHFYDSAATTFDVTAFVRLNVVPGPASAWAIINAEESDGLTVDENDRWTVLCGTPFTVFVEAVDEHGNRRVLQQDSCYQ